MHIDRRTFAKAAWVLIATALCGATVSDGHPIATFNTSLGSFQVALFEDAAPQSVQNFLSYVNSGAYSNTIIHRVVNDPGFQIVQGGGYSASSAPFPPAPSHIPTNPPIPLEYNLPNSIGTISMARTAVLNSATSEFFFNVSDNTDNLGPLNGGGYAVFGLVLGNGMSIVNAMNQTPRLNDFFPGYSGSPSDPANLLGPMPLVNFDPSADQIVQSNLIVINSVTVPEPSTIALAILGAPAILLYCLRRKRC